MLVPVLRAEWKDLVIASYAVPGDWVTPYLPPGVELDLWQGSAWVSLVAFNFYRLHLLGVTLPYPPTLCTFPEINLRTYVKRAGIRGITFLTELVPNRFVAWAANNLYKEHFIAAEVNHTVTVDGQDRESRFDFTVDGKPQTISAIGTGQPIAPEPDTQSEFFSERYIGYGGKRMGKTITFTVEHPPWRVYDTTASKVEVDFETNYGKPWGGLTRRAPDHVMLTEGSAVNVYPWSRKL